MSYDMRHGGPYDRGSADSYYRRSPEPHYYRGGTGTSEIVTEAEMTPAEIEAYLAGYRENDDFKDWGRDED
jgi:hypothetical protein